MSDPVLRSDFGFVTTHGFGFSQLFRPLLPFYCTVLGDGIGIGLPGFGNEKGKVRYRGDVVSFSGDAQMMVLFEAVDEGRDDQQKARPQQTYFREVGC